MDDPFNLRRFIDAQAQVYGRVVSELRSGRKRTHWMWFIFPQIRGLGRSPMAVEYAIGSLAEARAYLAHPALGARLAECTGIVLGTRGMTAREIFGDIDAMKFRSSMTLYSRAATGDNLFAAALAEYFGGDEDPRTLESIGE